MNKEFDPYDLDGKRKIHPKADAKNFLDVRQGKVVLRCGARKKRKDGLCKSLAGAGTSHPGYGRCKYCGGSNTGPKTEEGRKKSAQNARKHGLYAAYLNPDEQLIYADLLKKRDTSLMEEISLLKTKLASYQKYVGIQRQARGPKGLIRFKYQGESATPYEMGSIEDPNVHKTLEQIRRLVATANALNADDEESMLEKINTEIRAANKKDVDTSWDSTPQHLILENE